MLLRQLLLLTLNTLLLSVALHAQRVYRPGSVLNAGTWYKIAVQSTGIYRIDIPLLNNLGVNTSNLPSSSIRLFGNGGQMLSESNAGPWTDDLQENAIMVVDGGDGLLCGSDYILFYANGPDYWLKDSANQRFLPGQNLPGTAPDFHGFGEVIKMIQHTINTPGNRSSELEWDGKDDYGDKVGKGVYFYKLSVITPDKLRKEKIEKLVIF